MLFYLATPVSKILAILNLNSVMNVSELYLFLKESVSDPQGGRKGEREARRGGGGWGAGGRGDRETIP